MKRQKKYSYNVWDNSDHLQNKKKHIESGKHLICDQLGLKLWQTCLLWSDSKGFGPPGYQK